MLRPVAAGLMCLGFVTLDVAISQGQEDETDLIVIEGKVDATEVPVGEARENPQAGQRAPFGYAGVVAEAGAGGEANVSVNGQNFRIIRSENGGVVVLNEEGKVFERYAAGTEPGWASKRFTRIAQGPQVVDPQTRESLEKMTAALKEQIQKLESEGKKDEAQQKTHSLRAIESLLQGNHRAAAFVFQKQRDTQQALAEVQKLQARLNAMVEESAKLPEGAAAERDKIKQEIEKVKKEIAEKHQSLNAHSGVGGQPMPFVFGRLFEGGPPGEHQFHGGGFGLVPGQPGQPGQFKLGQFGHMKPSEGGILAQRAAALSQAAARLKEAGLPDQAKPLQEQAEQFKVKAEKMMLEEAEKNRAQAQAQGAGGFGGGGFHGFGGFFGGGPANDLNNSIRELHEQVQQLRKEVGELRELLQRKQ